MKVLIIGHDKDNVRPLCPDRGTQPEGSNTAQHQHKVFHDRQRILQYSGLRKKLLLGHLLSGSCRALILYLDPLLNCVMRHLDTLAKTQIELISRHNACLLLVLQLYFPVFLILALLHIIGMICRSYVLFQSLLQLADFRLGLDPSFGSTPACQDL
ncbi:hypothetical protein F5Y16DRAFT_1742 [Xylariaceae sp. FL0255]|nr:hypothetical protein F5Y16DRAFT_1742 [Xylariaceae sp. FL0255]